MLPPVKATKLRLRVHATKPIGSSRFTVKVNGTELKPITNVSAFYHNPYDTMVFPGEAHRRG